MASLDDLDMIEDTGGPPSRPRRSRRLSDKILMVFHAACDERDFHVAKQMLVTLEWTLVRSSENSPTDRRRNTEALVAAHERLWNLQRGPTSY